MDKRLLLAIALLVSGCARQDTSAQNSQVPSEQSVPAQRASGEVRIQRSQPRVGEIVTVIFRLKDGTGNPMADADVKAVFVMDTGSMTMRESTVMKWNGSEYIGSYKPKMAGDWEINVEARKNGALLLSMPSDIQVKEK